jgi:RNA polymerase sigma-54 factor
MNVRLDQKVALKQTLRLSQSMIQRFQVLEQSSESFEQMIDDESKKNPFIFYQRLDSSAPSGAVSDNDGISAVDFATYEESLVSVLTNQLTHQYLSERDTEVVLQLIDDCDEKGFIQDYKGVRARIMAEHNIQERDVFRCLKILQSFEPDGVGARTLNECLWIQIDHYGLDDPTDTEHLKLLVKHHLDDISNKDYDRILKQLPISQAELDNYIDFISHLNPNPGLRYSNHRTALIQPSLRVINDNGALRMENLEEQRIAVSLNQDMLKKLESEPTPELHRQLQNAKKWVAHFNKRQQLLQHCGEYLIEVQRMYFLEGQDFILPCLQKDIATQLSVAPSTISRLVRTKYILSDHGVVSLQVLCQRGFYGRTKTQVQALVAYYCKRHPDLSDLKLSELLKSIGLPIARRTVTKYRHQANMNTTYGRKKGTDT